MRAENRHPGRIFEFESPEGKVGAARRSASHELQSSCSPNFLTGLRSFSSGKYPPPPRRFEDSDSQRPSIVSVLESSSSSDGPTSEEASEFRSSVPEQSATYQGTKPCGYQPFRGPYSIVRRADGAVLDHYMLVPYITITPEARTMDGGVVDFWAAIEISGRLRCASKMMMMDDYPYDTDDDGCVLPIQPCDDDLARYGCLYDTQVEVLPAGDAAIIDLLDDSVAR